LPFDQADHPVAIVIVGEDSAVAVQRQQQVGAIGRRVPSRGAETKRDGVAGKLEPRCGGHAGACCRLAETGTLPAAVGKSIVAPATVIGKEVGRGHRPVELPVVASGAYTEVESLAKDGVSGDCQHAIAAQYTGSIDAHGERYVSVGILGDIENAQVHQFLARRGGLIHDRRRQRPPTQTVFAVVRIGVAPLGITAVIVVGMDDGGALMGVHVSRIGFYAHGIDIVVLPRLLVIVDVMDKQSGAGEVGIESGELPVLEDIVLGVGRRVIQYIAVATF